LQPLLMSMTAVKIHNTAFFNHYMDFFHFFDDASRPSLIVNNAALSCHREIKALGPNFFKAIEFEPEIHPEFQLVAMLDVVHTTQTVIAPMLSYTMVSCVTNSPHLVRFITDERSPAFVAHMLKSVLDHELSVDVVFTHPSLNKFKFIPETFLEQKKNAHKFRKMLI
jgi:hypothetical protein